MTTEAPWRVETLDIDTGVARVSVALNADPRILGPLVDLRPGHETTHFEAWRIIEMEDRSLSEILDSLPTHPGGQPL